MKVIKRIGIALIALIVIATAAFFIYVNDFYEASENVDSMMTQYQDRIHEEDDLTIIDAKENSDIGIVFYPGGKVEAIAYLPLLLQLANENINCVLVEMPFNLAVFNINGGLDAIEAMPNIKEWYLMGHSLGGAMASQFTEANYDLFEGLILLGAYPVNDAPIETMTLYGTYDIMLDLDKVSESDTVYEIEGGNHAYFGDYGEQDGDGTAIITRTVQQVIAVEKIIEFIGK